MSWFKKRNDSKGSRTSSDGNSVNSSECMIEERSRCDTDPDTCLEVFRNHWEQAYKIIQRDASAKRLPTLDEFEAVSQNFEQMVTLLAEEQVENGQGMPGPILHFLLEHDILDKFCRWCQKNSNDCVKLVEEQLRMFEHLISHSCQLLLIHKPIIRPLLNLLTVCSDGECTGEVEQGLVLVLHQVCVSISKEAVILESFFNTDADHGPTKFLIFSLLIPFLHREGKVGQQARDAFLLIMTLSAKHPYIGTYIAENSDFCPVLATGLSGLYSDLPRKIEVSFDNWYQLTDDYIQTVPEMIMFINSLEFCNAVTQIAHPLVRDQLIEYIYNGFLIPVLGPALHQNSREEVITATAYLDLFLRKISEASLIKSFLLFIFTEKNDEIVILESLITRLHSSTKRHSGVQSDSYVPVIMLEKPHVEHRRPFLTVQLCLVSLSLFHTLVDLNCEDVMFELVFKHLIPCTHVMVSQRRSVQDQDILCKSVEKFLSLRPTCCLPEIDSPKLCETRMEQSTMDLQNRSFGSKLEHFETSYLEYLYDAHRRQKICSQACQIWVYPYDGKIPNPNCFSEKILVADRSGEDLKESESNNGKCPQDNANNYLVNTGVSADRFVQNCDKKRPSTIVETLKIESTFMAVGEDRRVEPFSETDFILLLEESDSPLEKSVNVDDSMKNLETIFSSMSLSTSRTSTPRKIFSKPEACQGDALAFSSEFGDGSDLELSTVYYDCQSSEVDGDNALFKSVNDSSDVISTHTKANKAHATAIETVSLVIEENNHPSRDILNETSFVEIKTPEYCYKDSIPNRPAAVKNIADEIEKHQSVQQIDKENDGRQITKETAGKGEKSVRFAAPPECKTELISRPLSVSIMSSNQSSTPSIGPFLTALLLKLEGMMQNSFTVNLMLTGLISRLAVYPQPLLRSFLLNHTLVFQPTVKSLVQVLTTVRQRVDHYSYSVQNFEALLLRARRTLAQREGLLPERSHSMSPSPEMVHTKLRAATISDLPSKEKRHRTLTQLLFRRSPLGKKPSHVGTPKLEIIAGTKGIRYVNRKPESRPDVKQETAKTRNAVYCAIVLEEFVKELAALTQEHTVLFLEKEL